MADELEHVLLDSDEVSQHSPQVTQDRALVYLCKACRKEAFPADFEDHCTDWQDTEPAKGGANSAQLDKDLSQDDFYRQLQGSFASARTTPEAQSNTIQTAAVPQQPAASPPAGKGEYNCCCLFKAMPCASTITQAHLQACSSWIPQRCWHSSRRLQQTDLLLLLTTQHLLA